MCTIQIDYLAAGAGIGKSELIDIAKGKNKLPSNFNELKKQIKWQLNK